MFVRGVAAVAVVLLLATSCASSPLETVEPTTRSGVRIGSFDFAESELLAEVYAQALEARDLDVQRIGVVGPREIVAPAMEAGLIDVVPEYLGTVHAYFGALAGTSDRPEQALEDRGLRLLEPAEAQDVNVFVTTTGLASEYDLITVSDLARLPVGSRFGGPVECPDRQLCLAGLNDVYGLTFDFVPLRSLEVTAEALLRGEVEVALMFSTSAQFATDRFVALVDDKHLQPAENVVPLVRRAALVDWGSILSITLYQVSASLTTEILRELNQRVDAGEPPRAVAAAWLSDIGLVPS